MKKKIAAMCATVALAAVAVGGTLAYFTAEDQVKNTFTVGNIEIALDEADVDVYGEKLYKGEDGKLVTEDKLANGAEKVPAERVEANDYKLVPGHTYVKDPTVTVAKGSEPCYVRMLVTINMQDELDAIFGPNGLPLNTFFGGVSADWEYVGEVRNEDNTRTYEFRYIPGGNHVLDARTAKADVVLPALFTSFSVPADLTSEELATLVKVDETTGKTTQLTIDVAAQAIQKDSFDNADAAWAAFEVGQG